MSDNSMGTQFIAGESVFDVAGEKIGSVSEESVHGRYLVVQKGWLFPKDIYIPLNAVERNDAEGVYVSLHKDDLSSGQYENPPADVDAATASTTASDTATRDTSYVENTAVSGSTETVGTARVEANTRTETVTDANADVRVPVYQEELIVGKQAEELGRVHLHKDVVSELRTVTETVRREEVYVERVPLQGSAMAVGPDAFTEHDIDITVMGEELVASKRAVVAEEVRLRKQVTAEQQTITDTVRKERVVVDEVDETATNGQETGARSAYRDGGAS